MCSCEAGKKFIEQLMTSPAFQESVDNAEVGEDTIERLKSELLKRYEIVGGRFRLLFHDVKTCQKLNHELYSAIQKLTVEQLINLKTISISDFVPSLCYSITVLKKDKGTAGFVLI